MHACPCMRTHAQAELEHACIYACIHTHALGFLWPFFSQKKSFILPKLSYIFHKNFLKSNFIWLGPKPTLGFRVLTSLGNEGLGHKGYKMRCLYRHRLLSPYGRCLLHLLFYHWMQSIRIDDLLTFDTLINTFPNGNQVCKILTWALIVFS